MTFVKLALLLLLTISAESRNITILNKCPFTIWPGILGRPGNPAGGGFRLDASESRDIENSEQCNGAGGVPPASLAEFTLKPWGGQDFYDVSLIDGYNLPVQIEPRGGSGCKRAGGCVKDINSECPVALAVKGHNGNVVACKSGCLEYNTDQECCRGAYGTPDKCHRSATAQMFKDACPTAYTALFSCLNWRYCYNSVSLEANT
ncbi:hypothetical protein GCK72_015351 [Caenorhabditis remanei]|uniref:Uncharacterized protein n=1 Tax=Caenorhabditis remanei TaxID=31234 RepID=A0A6A5GTU5_CAERE|nr:hypothetical protein GCK72_015350 [Caenorhabditis remanei]XP_053585576.1 hypothetical protein GCK72_015351 [Caenorhabditis remanei]KAF1758890.1 hypothetical protein GCK72_015350 [Caenorhabditis remanei]KAF1758891.1 hypothetical protein GCK72_015351 [Caenorhabditis remanei]